MKASIGGSQVTGKGSQPDKGCDRWSPVSLDTEKWPLTPGWEVKEGFSEPLHQMIDPSCLKDICGDPNVWLKPIEHTVWVVREGGLEVFFVV